MCLRGLCLLMSLESEESSVGEFLSVGMSQNWVDAIFCVYESNCV